MDANQKAREVLEMYETRLRFIDVYDVLLEKFSAALLEAAPPPPLPDYFAPLTFEG